MTPCHQPLEITSEHVSDNSCKCRNAATPHPLDPRHPDIRGLRKIGSSQQSTSFTYSGTFHFAFRASLRPALSSITTMPLMMPVCAAIHLYAVAGDSSPINSGHIEYISSFFATLSLLDCALGPEDIRSWSLRPIHTLRVFQTCGGTAALENTVIRRKLCSYGYEFCPGSFLGVSICFMVRANLAGEVSSSAYLDILGTLCLSNTICAYKGNMFSNNYSWKKSDINSWAIISLLVTLSQHIMKLCILVVLGPYICCVLAASYAIDTSCCKFHLSKQNVRKWLLTVPTYTSQSGIYTRAVSRCYTSNYSSDARGFGNRRYCIRDS
jgi:hypothetical protein